MQWFRRLAAVRCLGVPLPDRLLAAALVLFAVLSTAGQVGAAHPWSEIVGAVTAGAIALRTRAPLAMSVTAAVGIAVLACLPGASTPMWSFVTVLLISFSAAAHLPGRRAAAGVGLLLLAGYAIQLVTDDNPVERILTPLVVFGGPALAGWLLRRSRTQALALRRLAAALAEEREKHAEAAAAAERTHIAREMHDVISHSVSVMLVQAGAAEQLMSPGDPAVPHVRAVRSAGRDALGELRRLLGLLRTDGGSAAAPQPTLADLPRLVSDAGARLTVQGTLPPTVEPGVQLAAYRIAQEALTNALRHARGASIRVHARYEPEGVRLRIEDDGGRPASAPGTGQGLTGMAQRAALYGGEVQAGPQADGRGWHVTAVLPLAEPIRNGIVRR